jgi:REP element-mobilizing transposase RayT
MAFDIYRHRLPHARLDRALYFVIWRIKEDRGDLSAEERDLIVSVLRHFDGLRYVLHAYVVMNDHVHVLVDPHPGFRLENILHSWKSFSAKHIGRLRRHVGPIWQEEYFNRVVWSEPEYEQKRDYILANPFRRWPALQTYRWCWAIGMEEP